MLDRAFIETAEYQTLIASRDRCVVVGRRGTGKSALVRRLKKFWEADKRNVFLALAPYDDQIIALRESFSKFGDKYTHVRSAARMAWKYALLMELLGKAKEHYRSRIWESSLLRERLAEWNGPGGFAGRLRQTMRTRLIKPGSSGPELLGDMSQALLLPEVMTEATEHIRHLKSECVLLADRLDEGYEPDLLGVAIVGGLVQAAIDLNTQSEGTRVSVFLRDNIFRALQKLDPDYSRNIESHVLRLHWDEHQLFRLVAERVRAAFDFPAENDLKVWNRWAVRDLAGRDGFRKCLQQTLYRPRDVLVLLNEAFRQAQKQDRSEIIGDDLDASAREVSQNRLDDLHKEYGEIFPGLRTLTSAFSGLPPDRNAAEIYQSLDELMSRDAYTQAVQQEFRILEGSENAVRALYSVGFLGTRDATSGHYVFCHDGRSPDKGFTESDRLLVHPCYWMALNIVRSGFDPAHAEQIYDEFDIEVTSDQPEIRKASLGRQMSALDRIPVGEEGAGAFEEWCLKVVKILWPGHLRNIELHPNRTAVQRRDIVASNLAERGVFKRLQEDYNARQLIFEVKNYPDLTADDFRQMKSYLTGDFGQMGFVITRTSAIDPSHNELVWIRELYNSRPGPFFVVKLSAQWLVRQLGKVRAASKHDEPELQLNKLIDTYHRVYLSESASKRAGSVRRKRGKRR
jgi:hypothetical protein